jgi:2-polyprenyl-3-methyl-5-hydroxy-6-metoxy-1,4-benzoquinol methylase
MNKENISCSSEDINQEQDLKSHWNNAYTKIEVHKLGWYEDNLEPSLQLIQKCNLNLDAKILNVGAGATTLVDELLKQGYTNVIANDLSQVALNKLKTRLGDKGDAVQWIVDDLTKPTALISLNKIDLWHDRAVVHFFNDENEQNIYFNLVKTLVKDNGFVIIATFNLDGATKCSGLPVHRYNAQMLQDKLGETFKLIETFDYIYIMPSGDTRAYVYSLFQKN